MFGDNLIEARLGANVEGLTTGMHTASRSVQTSVVRMNESLGGLGTAIERVRVPFVALIALFAGGALFKDTISSTRAFGVQLELLAQKAGIAATELSRLQFAAEKMDVDTSSLDVGVKMLSRNMEQSLILPSTNAARAFRALGISITDIKTSSLDSMMLKLADRFHSFANGWQKTALALALFGRSGSDLIPILNQGSAGMAALEGRADALGATLTTQQEQVISRYDQAMKDVTGSMRGLRDTAATALMPALTGLAQAFVTATNGGQEFMPVLRVVALAFQLLGTAIIGIQVPLEQVWQFAFHALQSIADLVLGVERAIVDLAHGKFHAAVEDIKSGFGEATIAAQDWADQSGAAIQRAHDELAAVWGFGPKQGALPTEVGKGQAPDMSGTGGHHHKGQFSDDVHVATQMRHELAKFQEETDRAFEHFDQGVTRMQEKAGHEMAKLDAKSLRTGIEAATRSIHELSQELHRSGVAALKSAAEMKREWMSAFEAIHQAMSKSFTAVIQGTLTMQAAERNAIRSIELEVIAAEERKLQAKVAAWLASKGITIESALQQIGAHAATAAAGAWSALASIPYVGPFIAPVAAAAALAGVLALGKQITSAAGGYDVPAGVNPITQLHAEEMVLPREYAAVIRGMAGSGGGGGGGSTMVNHWNVQAWDAKSVRDMTLMHRDAFVPMLRQLAIEGKL